MPFFKPSTWPLAIMGLSPSVLREIKTAALTLTSILPAGPTVDVLTEEVVVEQLGILNQAITAAREQSAHAEHWPESGIPDISLVLWTMGLSTHLMINSRQNY